MMTPREIIIGALQAHAYTSYDYGYHCSNCNHAEATLAGMIGHIADGILADATLPTFIRFQIEWQVRDTKTGHVDDGVFASRAEAEQMLRNEPARDLELVCRETGATEWHRPVNGAVG